MCRFPRVELNESRQRVPSFYVLDIARAIEGHIPPAQSSASARVRGGRRHAGVAGAARSRDRHRRLRARPGDDGRRCWRNASDSVKGRARYLYELSPELQRSLSSRWLRWHRKQWEPADGIVRSTDSDARRARRRNAWARGRIR